MSEHNDNDDFDPEQASADLMNQQRESVTHAADQDDELSPLAEEMLERYEDVDDWSSKSNIQARSKALAVILETIDEDEGRRAELLETAEAEFGVDDGGDGDQAELVRTLLRVGLLATNEETIEAWKEAHDHQSDDAF